MRQVVVKHESHRTVPKFLEILLLSLRSPPGEVDFDVRCELWDLAAQFLQAVAEPAYTCQIPKRTGVDDAKPLVRSLETIGQSVRRLKIILVKPVIDPVDVGDAPCPPQFALQLLCTALRAGDDRIGSLQCTGLQSRLPESI